MEPKRNEWGQTEAEVHAEKIGIGMFLFAILYVAIYYGATFFGFI